MGGKGGRREKKHGEAFPSRSPGAWPSGMATKRDHSRLREVSEVAAVMAGLKEGAQTVLKEDEE